METASKPDRQLASDGKNAGEKCQRLSFAASWSLINPKSPAARDVESFLWFAGVVTWSFGTSTYARANMASEILREVDILDRGHDTRTAATTTLTQ